MPKCTFLVGMPGTGKSTYALQADVPVISTDNTIETIAHNYGFTYNESLELLYSFAERVMWADLQEAYEAGADILIDRTNLTVKSHARFIKALDGYTFEALVFPCGDTWVEDLASRPGKLIPANVIERMILSYEEPTHSEGFSLIKEIIR